MSSHGRQDPEFTFPSWIWGLVIFLLITGIIGSGGTAGDWIGGALTGGAISCLLMAVLA